ncbi:hypothetical protein BKA69DRAFT_1077368 [Paraphysoderma sedebokerense]|nr:hypothetical protein BKA69DRAFT_1077368 [Paraphysoderma sedebokerense]
MLSTNSPPNANHESPSSTNPPAIPSITELAKDISSSRSPLSEDNLAGSFEKQLKLNSSAGISDTVDPSTLNDSAPEQISTPIVYSPTTSTSSSIDIIVTEPDENDNDNVITLEPLSDEILVALADDRATEIKDLVSYNEDLFKLISTTLCDIYPSFLSTLYTPRSQMSDQNWLAQLSSVLAQKNPVLWDNFTKLVGYIEDADYDPFDPFYFQDHLQVNQETRAISERSVSEESLNIEYQDHPAYHTHAHVDVTSLRSIPPYIMESFPSRYPKFIETVDNFMIQHRLGKESMEEFMDCLMCQDRHIMSDEEWEDKMKGFIGMVPKLWGQFQEIVAYEIDSIDSGAEDTSSSSGEGIDLRGQ